MYLITQQMRWQQVERLPFPRISWITATIEVRVTDTGSGIRPENLDKLFTPFFTTKPAGKGTGLGLAIVYGIIKMHRGQIRVESQPGQGTTIIITLPVRLPGGQSEAIK